MSFAKYWATGTAIRKDDRCRALNVLIGTFDEKPEMKSLIKQGEAQASWVVPNHQPASHHHLSVNINININNIVKKISEDAQLKGLLEGGEREKQLESLKAYLQ